MEMIDKLPQYNAESLRQWLKENGDKLTADDKAKFQELLARLEAEEKKGEA